MTTKFLNWKMGILLGVLALAHAAVASSDLAPMKLSGVAPAGSEIQINVNYVVDLDKSNNCKTANLGVYARENTSIDALKSVVGASGSYSFLIPVEKEKSGCVMKVSEWDLLLVRGNVTSAVRVITDQLNNALSDPQFGPAKYLELKGTQTISCRFDAPVVGDCEGAENFFSYFVPGDSVQLNFTPSTGRSERLFSE